jgi:DNA-binding MarR family transcriptional regulator
MTMRRPSGRRALAAQAWRRLFDFFISTRRERDATLERFRLTPNDSKALSTLDQNEGRPMRALADAWGTDASNATWVVDRLERLGLAERRTIATDRRVKLVVLTSRGLAARDEIMRAFREPPAAMLALESRDLHALSEILGKLIPDAIPHQPSSGYGSPMATRRTGRRRSAGKNPRAASKS